MSLPVSLYTYYIYKGESVLHADDGESVAQGKDDFLHTRVGGYQVVEGLYVDGLLVTLARMLLKHVTIPQSVVGQNEAAGLMSGTIM